MRPRTVLMQCAGLMILAGTAWAQIPTTGIEDLGGEASVVDPAYRGFDVTATTTTSWIRTRVSWWMFGGTQLIYLPDPNGNDSAFVAPNRDGGPLTDVERYTTFLHRPTARDAAERFGLDSIPGFFRAPAEPPVNPLDLSCGEPNFGSIPAPDPINYLARVVFDISAVPGTVATTYLRTGVPFGPGYLLPHDESDVLLARGSVLAETRDGADAGVGNAVPWQMYARFEADCDGNGVPDEMDLANGTGSDCDQNGLLDACQEDCNENGVADACEAPLDADGDGFRDDCTVYVDDDATPGGDGASWATAYDSLTAATAAHRRGSRFQIAGGTYSGNVDVSHAALIGGYAGLAGSGGDERDPNVHVTTVTAGSGTTITANMASTLRDLRIVDGDVGLRLAHEATLRGCEISGHTSTSAAAVVIAENSFVVMRDVQMRNNSGQTAGAIDNHGVLQVYDGVFEGNTGVQGGAIRSADTLSLNRCLVSDNHAPGGEGGALASTFGDVSAFSCLFENNTADRGGMGWFRGETTSIFFSTVTGNSADFGNVLYGADDPNLPAQLGPEIYYSVIWDNGVDRVDASDDFFADPNQYAGPVFSIVQPPLGTIFDQFAILQDPQFADPNNGDYRLQLSSPALDRVNVLAFEFATLLEVQPCDDRRALPLDLDGRTRSVDVAGVSNGGTVDYGAYEHGSQAVQPCRGDVTADGQVDLADLAAILAAFQADASGDINCDGRTDLTDLAEVLAHFGDPCS